MHMQQSLFDDASACLPVSASQPTQTRPKVADAKAEYEAWHSVMTDMSTCYEETHLWFLKRNLQILGDPQTGDDERSDILAWIDAPLSEDKTLKAFSFNACLMLYDPRCDTSAAREQIRAINQKVLARRQTLAQ